MLESQIEAAKRQVKTDSYQISIGELINNYRDGELIINPDFQRLFRWEIGQKSRLIESILLGIPLPSIFVFELENSKWELIDGLQRISTLLQFMGFLRKPESVELERPISLIGTKYLSGLDKIVWEKSEAIEGIALKDQIPLTSSLQLAIRRSRINVEILKRPSSNETKYDLFQRLNAGGTQANEQELRNAIVIMVNPEYYKLLKRCAQRESFGKILSASEDQIEKQRDVEYVSRFIVHVNVDYNGKMDVEEFISYSIVELARSENSERQEKVFCDTFDLLDQVYGSDSLRRFKNGNPYGRVLLAAYECIAIGIGRNIDFIKSKPDPADYVRKRINDFWRSNNIDSFFVAGLRGTVRLQRTIPFGIDWFSK